MAEAHTEFTTLGVSSDKLLITLTADARYRGQGFELRVPLNCEAARELGATHVAERFHDVHARRYGHSFANQEVEVTALRISASSPSSVDLSHWRAGVSTFSEERRRILLDETSQEGPLMERALLGEV